MNQTYTWEFQCKYELQRYPFDTQVYKESNSNTYPSIIALWPQECKIKMTVMDLAIDTVELLADQVTSNKPTNTNKEESKDPQVLKTY